MVHGSWFIVHGRKELLAVKFDRQQGTNKHSGYEP
jgi:hypothetical protein